MTPADFKILRSVRVLIPSTSGEEGGGDTRKTTLQKKDPRPDDTGLHRDLVPPPTREHRYQATPVERQPPRLVKNPPLWFQEK